MNYNMKYYYFLINNFYNSQSTNKQIQQSFQGKCIKACLFYYQNTNYVFLKLVMKYQPFKIVNILNRVFHTDLKDSDIWYCNVETQKTNLRNIEVPQSLMNSEDLKKFINIFKMCFQDPKIKLYQHHSTIDIKATTPEQISFIEMFINNTKVFENKSVLMYNVPKIYTPEQMKSMILLSLPQIHITEITIFKEAPKFNTFKITTQIKTEAYNLIESLIYYQLPDENNELSSIEMVLAVGPSLNKYYEKFRVSFETIAINDKNGEERIVPISQLSLSDLRKCAQKYGRVYKSKVYEDLRGIGSIVFYDKESAKKAVNDSKIKAKLSFNDI
ncbi:hypothetical protein TRFO_31575 [Tritrichomonas foetus]|uniref:RRM domain-containing protein n=1 Tax=Tritrichomonas foetus TaxID=1144522 RepID=A0A1J4JQZ7_9EUKA|nr:hypothetical protein TRFO_31575 [Tritrichomonas foetus]|eukprot:OHT01545.1 hypothetical protein TRFO_31575 [Tritrichomonas foetus]